MTYIATCIMSTMVDDAVPPVVADNEAWAQCIARLLEKHGLTARAAAAKVGYRISHGYISDWLKGRRPNAAAAVEFLQHFPREEAVECLEAGGFPVPEDWRDPADVLRAQVDKLTISEATRKKMYRLIEQALKEDAEILENNRGREGT